MTYGALWLAWPTHAVRLINDTTGRELACAAAQTGLALRLTYVHSIYGQPAAEEFVVGVEGLELVRLRSASVPVLEYYARRESIRQEGAEHVIEVPHERHASLTVLVSALGQRAVHYDGRVWALPDLAADGDRVRLTVERAPRLCTLWPRQPR
jgi:hypothetical protein